MKYFNMYPRGVSLFMILLCVLGMNAQTYLQYWFDTDQKAERADLSGAGIVEQAIDVQHLSQGLHTLYMRARTPGAEYEYSPISTSTFFKFITSEGSVLEYWFDEDVDNPSTIAVNVELGKEQILTLDLSNIERFPLGVHQLNMRVAHNGGHYSPVYSAYVLRLPSGTGESMLEYWFDEDYENHASIPVSIDNDMLQKLDLDLSDMTKFPYGFHRLNIRVASNGSQYSPVYSANVMRLRSGPNNYLTYWLDEDYTNRRHTWSTTGNGKDAYFKVHLDFSTASDGMHRLHYRISSQEIDDGPVYEEPILVTRKYNNATNVTVVNQSYWLDDVTTVIKAISDPKDVVSQTYTLIPENYSVGQHAFYVQYQNSADVWSEENVTYFYKEGGANGRLREGIMPEDPTGINNVADAESFGCSYNNGTIYVDCQSPRLGNTGVIMVCDMTGRVVAQQSVPNSDGIHAAVSVENLSRQLLIVKLVSGDVRYSQKVMKR